MNMPAERKHERLFDTGQLVMTRGVNNKIADDLRFSAFVLRSIARHVAGDWGDLGDEDKQANDQALTIGERLFSAYLSGDIKIWVITEADRSSTCVLFPDEY